jgi:DNA-binding winged helix-turn-helix (wHTH) protein
MSYRKTRGGQSRLVILELLARSNASWVSHEAIIDALWGHDPNGGPDYPGNIVAVHVMHLRRALRAYGVEIRNVFGAGYGIPREQRGRALEVMNEVAEVCATATKLQQLKLCPHCGKPIHHPAGGSA